MKTVCRAMGLARSHVRELRSRDDSWTDGRRHRTPKDDAQLLAELRQEIAELPSHGYQPTIRRLARSITEARYTYPLSVST